MVQVDPGSSLPFAVNNDPIQPIEADAVAVLGAGLTRRRKLTWNKSLKAASPDGTWLYVSRLILTYTSAPQTALPVVTDNGYYGGVVYLQGGTRSVTWGTAAGTPAGPVPLGTRRLELPVHPDQLNNLHNVGWAPVELAILVSHGLVAIVPESNLWGTFEHAYLDCLELLGAPKGVA